MEFAVPVFLVFVIFVLFKTIVIVRQAEELVIERFGKYSRNLKSGIQFLVPGMDRVAFRADMREQIHNFDPQPVITKDNTTVYINAVTYYKIISPQSARYEVESYELAIEQLVNTTLRNLIGELELDETLASRNVVNSKLQTEMDEVTVGWGIKVTRVEVAEIQPAPDIQEAMSTQMVAERNRRAAILEAEGEKKAAILEAEGKQQAAVLDAKGHKESAVIRAKGYAEAELIRAEAEKLAMEQILSAFDDASAEERLIALKYIEMLPKLADGKGVSLVIPDRLSEIGSLTSLAGKMLNPPAADRVALPPKAPAKQVVRKPVPPPQA